MSAADYPTCHSDPAVRPPPDEPFVLLQFAGPTLGTGPAGQSWRVAAQLGTFLTDEGSGVAAVLEGLDLRGAQADLAALSALHATWGNQPQPLFEAERLLEELLEALAEIPARAQFCWPLPEALRGSAHALDTAVCWYGARTEDLLKSVRHAIRLA